MPPSSFSALAPVFEFPGADRRTATPPIPELERAAIFEALRQVLEVYLQAPGEATGWENFQAARRAACSAIVRMPRQYRLTPDIHQINELVRMMGKSGVHDRIVDAEDLAQANELGRKDWRGILAAMLLVPAWQWPAAPLVLEVPDWLRADYVRWLFAAPSHFSAVGQAEAYGAFTLRRLEEMVRWLKRGPSVQEEMKVLGAYASHSTLLPSCFGADHLRYHAELRGSLLWRAMGVRDDRYVAPILRRTGRRLRIGIIHRHFESLPETYAVLPLFEQLDPDRFEVILFTYVNDFSRVEDYCRQKAAALLVLPADIKDQLALLRNAALDVALFSTNVTAECNVVTRLALHRVAPLQVVNQASGITSGLPEIDLYLTGEDGVAAGGGIHFTERLGVMKGPGQVFNFAADGEEAENACTRADFGLPEDAFVFVSTASYRSITPEMQRTWAELLAAVPDSYLLVHPFHPGTPSGHAIHNFYAAFERALKKAGVDASRLAVSCVAFPMRTDVKSLVGLGDVYLDTNNVSAAESLVDPLELGLPVVAWEGSTSRSRTGASLLRTLAMDALVASTSAGYKSVAMRLATDAVYRESCGTAICAGMRAIPAFLDSTAASRAFGDLMERAWDELARDGRAAFRSNPTPLRAAAVDGWEQPLPPDAA